MPKTMRKRIVCKLPEYYSFTTRNIKKPISIELTLDELETIRLVDYQKLTHKQASEKMGISRTTVSEIYEIARFKIADFLINGKSINVRGGNYQLCNNDECKYCKIINQLEKGKGDLIMRVALPYESGNIFQHFGHCTQFMVYDILDKEIIKKELVSTNGKGHGYLGSFLYNIKVNAVICGGIGKGAQTVLTDNNISIYGGVNSNCDDAINLYINNALDYDPNVKCNHHDHNHNCGNDDKGNCKGPTVNV